jgi:hypothetical protein
MKDITGKFMIFSSIIITILLIVSAPCVGQDFYAKTNANSPDGSVPHGAKAYSPDGKYYVREVQPYEEGNIAAFEVNGDREIQRWDLLPNNNDLKGLAWAPDSKRIAVMYHGGMTLGIQVVELGKAGVVATASFRNYPHLIAWDKNGEELLLLDTFNPPVQRVTFK